MQKVILASGNAGKLREFQRILAEFDLDVAPQSDYNVPDAEETGLTFVENAILKARNACAHTGFAAISDDSGIEVDALNGQPGIYSARFSGPGATDAKNNALLLEKLEGLPEAERTARYQCVLVYMRHATDPTPIICQGAWEGTILTAPRGEGGFGYDPLFWVPSHQCASAELPAEVKNSISHRAIAMQALLVQIRAQQAK
ncbi:RdgB/HAM1 family non-canonical purine NTP pyrophosphatase [Saccharophagus degradans]|uniref:dITP/XTP pyrophosphatase n=1 Tax=Saccharophagus degradans TaxID=86304 RepID=A0AAW7X9K1_9GAMM|nr:RdgB/HAM1 family non-canonical purine NTP pyrophosphatase [Saccharophagus degradans]MDO6423547.1 RdgB/HAM1 family non-canonical purine NTP pyrophosphatase [Saccharophagus degradans]MDO6607781.1 RdgB/HAM1 family non-canonical purine NTP pyrophosphatase [Saccharophagus degradans]